MGEDARDELAIGGGKARLGVKVEADFGASGSGASTGDAFLSSATKKLSDFTEAGGELNAGRKTLRVLLRIKTFAVPMIKIV